MSNKILILIIVLIIGLLTAGFVTYSWLAPVDMQQYPNIMLPMYDFEKIINNEMKLFTTIGSLFNGVLPQELEVQPIEYKLIEFTTNVLDDNSNTYKKSYMIVLAPKGLTMSTINTYIQNNSVFRIIAFNDFNLQGEHLYSHFYFQINVLNYKFLMIYNNGENNKVMRMNNSNRNDIAYEFAGATIGNTELLDINYAATYVTYKITNISTMTNFNLTEYDMTIPYEN